MMEKIEVGIIKNLKQNKINTSIFNSKSYKYLNRILIIIYSIFMLVYAFRGNLYKLENKYITLFAETAPNLIPSFLFTLIGMFYIVPRFFNEDNAINKPSFIWPINILNIIVFAFIEYLHLVFNLGVWDNNDVIASLIGIIFSTIFYFKFKKVFVVEQNNLKRDKVYPKLYLLKEDTMNIRIAKKSDAKELVEYINKISGESNFLTFGEGEFKKNIEEEEGFIDNNLKQENALFIIAEVEGKIVGTLNFAGGTRLRTAHTGEFGVSVLKEYWRQGIGTELIQYLIDWCKKSGVIRKINLRVRSDNNSAIHVYKKLGFNEEGVITRDYLINGKFYDSIFMGLIID